VERGKAAGEVKPPSPVLTGQYSVPALGLRARGDDVFIVPQTASDEGDSSMWLFSPRKAQPMTSVRPRLEVLEDRCVPSSGALDPSFGSGGSVTTELAKADSYAHGVLLQSNGDLIAYGVANTGTTYRSPVASFGLARYTPNGSLDKTFAKTGEVVTSQVGKTAITIQVPAYTVFTAGEGVAQAALQSDGKIVAVGNDSYLVRYNSNGSLDTTFGSQGLVVVPSGFSVQSLLIQPSDGDIVAGGSYNSDFALLRYTPSGALDSTFGSGGEVVTSGAAATVVALALENVDIVAGGTGVVARYTLSGNLDTTFGSGGIVAIPMGSPSLLVQPNGQIVAVGTVTIPSPYGDTDWELARYNVNGSLDSTFGSGGVVTGKVPGGNETVAYGSALQSNGQIVVLGENLGLITFAVAVYNANGSLDTSFGSGGFVTHDGGSAGGGEAIGGGIAIQPDGKIVAAMSVGLGVPAFVLARYGPSAAQISSFTASPDPVAPGSSLTLTASNITLADPSSTITQVAFYYVDSSGDLQLLGYGTDNNGTWTLTFTVNLASGSYTVYAQATDSDGILGDLAALTLRVQ
jgi:uncharacterized delta-60 repeat protein